MRRFTPTPAAQTESLEILRELLAPGDTVYVTTTQVARSGMSRRVKVFIPRVTDGHGYEPSRAVIRDITWHVGRALRWQLVDDGSWELRVDGAGMDMHFHLVYTLGRKLFTNDDTVGRHHSDPGYLLTKETL